MEIDPFGGGARVTSGASGSEPSATAARRRTPGRWRRIPRAIPSLRKAEMSSVWKRAMPMEAGKAEMLLARKRAMEAAGRYDPPTAGRYDPPTAGRYDPPPSTGRLQKTAVDQKKSPGVDQKDSPPSFRFEIVSYQKNPPTFRSVLVENQTIPPTPRAETGADQNPSPSTGLLQERDKEVDMEVVEQGWESEEMSNLAMLKRAERLELEADEGLCDTEEHTKEDEAEFRFYKLNYAAFYRHLATTKSVFIFKPPSDTIEEHLSAEEMERQANISGWPVCSQAQHFATLALKWYNTTKKTHKFEIAKVLLSKCFSDVDYNMYAHVNFTATPTSHSHSPKRLFFAELMLVPNLLACKDTEPMRVLNVSTIDDCCFGGCHEMVRDIKGPVRKDMDYERCHACSERIKHPRGDQ